MLKLHTFALYIIYTFSITKNFSHLYHGLQLVVVAVVYFALKHKDSLNNLQLQSTTNRVCVYVLFNDLPYGRICQLKSSSAYFILQF